MMTSAQKAQELGWGEVEVDRAAVPGAEAAFEVGELLGVGLGTQDEGAQGVFRGEVEVAGQRGLAVGREELNVPAAAQMEVEDDFEVAAGAEGAGAEAVGAETFSGLGAELVGKSGVAEGADEAALALPRGRRPLPAHEEIVGEGEAKIWTGPVWAVCGSCFDGMHSCCTGNGCYCQECA